jgi:ATP-dependent helicase/nuclease subunit B
VKRLGRVETIAPSGAPAAIQEQLFSQRADLAAPPAALTIFSAPGESRECVEIARIARAEADAGTRFDRMAVLLRAPSRYRAHLEEALRRAGIPAHFARGTARPDPSGRALLSLLACKLEALSATRFAEYLSLGELPPAEPTGAPPPATDRDERWVPADSEVVGDAVARAAFEDEAEETVDALDVEPGEDAPVAYGTLRAPRLWERLLVEAAVIEDKSRWASRLAGLENELRADLEQAKRLDDASAARFERDLDALAGLRDFALPILDVLESLPERATWGEWIDALSALASRALRRPARVLAALAELAPMAEVGPLDLREVRLVLEQRLGDVVDPPAASRYGRIFLATPDEARGMELDVVFVPGLAEKMFPQKVIEDPILPDATREGTPLARNEARAAAERLALRLAVGAAGGAASAGPRPSTRATPSTRPSTTSPSSSACSSDRRPRPWAPRGTSSGRTRTSGARCASAPSGGTTSAGTAPTASSTRAPRRTRRCESTTSPRARFRRRRSRTSPPALIGSCSRPSTASRRARSRRRSRTSTRSSAGR